MMPVIRVIANDRNGGILDRQILDRNGRGVDVKALFGTVANGDARQRFALDPLRLDPGLKPFDHGILDQIRPGLI